MPPQPFIYALFFITIILSLIFIPSARRRALRYLLALAILFAIALLIHLFTGS
jgi:hypothetical protein